MRQVTLTIQDNKFGFFMDLINNLDFVKIESEDSEPTKEAIKQNILTGLREVEMIERGEMKATTLKEFLDEL
jgi:hypothetical protein